MLFPPGHLRVTKGPLALRHRLANQFVPPFFQEATGSVMGTAGNMPPVYRLHLNGLAAEKHVFCPKKAAPFLLLGAEVPLHAVPTGGTGRTVRPHRKRLPAGGGSRILRTSLPTSAPRRARVWQLPPLAPDDPDVITARRRRSRPLAAFHRQPARR